VGARLWTLFALWPLVVLGFFTVSPFKLPHYGLAAFPALALLAARVWDDTIEALPGAVPPRLLLPPVCVLFGLLAVALAAAWAGVLPIVDGALTSVDVATRNLAARGQSGPAITLESWASVLASAAIIFGLGAGAMAVATWRRSPAFGVGAALATMLAFLPVAGEGVAQFARLRGERPIAEALLGRLRPGDLVLHEGPLENSGALLLVLPEPVRIVNGVHSSLAFGATFPDAREIFWDAARLREAWSAPGRRYLVSVVPPDQSVVRGLPPGAVHLVAQGGGRWLYTNAAD
jgi:hypothetical protein